VEVLEMDPLANVPSAVLGWADARRFFGDYSRGLGLGDDRQQGGGGGHSAGITLQRSRPTQLRHRGRDAAPLFGTVSDHTRARRVG
jgi:hypothetical protein